MTNEQMMLEQADRITRLSDRLSTMSAQMIDLYTEVARLREKVRALEAGAGKPEPFRGITLEQWMDR